MPQNCTFTPTRIANCPVKYTSRTSSIPTCAQNANLRPPKETYTVPIHSAMYTPQKSSNLPTTTYQPIQSPTSKHTSEVYTPLLNSKSTPYKANQNQLSHQHPPQANFPTFRSLEAPPPIPPTTIPKNLSQASINPQNLQIQSPPENAKNPIIPPITVPQYWTMLLQSKTAVHDSPYNLPKQQTLHLMP